MMESLSLFRLEKSQRGLAGDNPRSSNVRLRGERRGEDDVVAPPMSDEESEDIVVAPCDRVVMLDGGVVLHSGEL